MNFPFYKNNSMKLLNFLITFQAFEYTITELIRNTKISCNSLYKILKTMQEKGMITKNKKKYKLNTDNEIVKLFIKLDWELIH